MSDTNCPECGHSINRHSGYSGCLVGWDMNGEPPCRCMKTPSEVASDEHHTMEELYEYRMLYNAAAFNAWHLLGINDVHKSWRHSDGEECFRGGWFIVSAQLPFGQITNHYRAKDWDQFHIPTRDRAQEWDSHNSAIAADRLRQYNSRPFIRDPFEESRGSND